MNRSIFGGLGLIVIAGIAFLLYLSVFVVDKRQQALVLRFGQIVRPETEPGLKFKLPLVDNVVYIEKRIIELDSPPLEIIASDQKRLVVDAFGRYRIVDPLLFYQSVGTIFAAESRLETFLNSAVRRVLGEASFIELVRDDRSSLMSAITSQVNREGARLGLEVVDVKIKRADLPEANSQAIYQRMQTERQREATEIRAQGEEAARRIRAEADRTTAILIAEANREADRLRGEGDAGSNRIFAEAFGRDPEFFAFYRSMQAYQAGLQSGDTRLVISPDSAFFRYFNDPGTAFTSSLPTRPGAIGTTGGSSDSESDDSAAASPVEGGGADDDLPTEEASLPMLEEAPPSLPVGEDNPAETATQ